MSKIAKTEKKKAINAKGSSRRIFFQQCRVICLKITLRCVASSVWLRKESPTLTTQIHYRMLIYKNNGRVKM